MVGSLAALVGVLLFVAVVINYPFAGDVAVDPEPFHRVVADFSPRGRSSSGSGTVAVRGTHPRVAVPSATASAARVLIPSFV
jgi:hypothetical protein